MDKKYLAPLVLMFSYLWFNSFGRSVLPVHLLSQGISISGQMLSIVLIFLAQGLVLLFFRKYGAKSAWFMATIFTLISILLSINLINSIQFYIASLISGLALAVFWVPYNIAYFKKTPTKDIGKNSSIMFSFFPAIGIFAPLLAGFLAEINIALVWALTAFFFFIPLLVVSKQENFPVSYSIKEALNNIKPVRWLLFLEGIWEAVVFCIIPIYTLYFIQTPGYYGTFLAYLSAAGLVANLVLGRFSDRVQKRAIFLYPITIALALITFIFPFATQDLFYWTIVAGLIQFFLPLFWNIAMAMVVDISPNLDLAIPGREIMMMSGRILGSILVFVSLLIEKTPFYIFFVLGGVMLLYTFVLFWSTKISKKYKYL